MLRPKVPTKRGELEKDGVAVMGMFGGGFQARYFVLERSTLQYYDTQDDQLKDPKGSIDIWKAQNITVGDDNRTINVDAFDQKEDNERRTYHLRAKDSLEARDW